MKGNRKKKKRFKIFINRFLFISILIILFAVMFKVKDRRNTEINTKEDYLNVAKPIAVSTARKYNLYPSVVLAQSALESNFGQSELSEKYNNYFGIKALPGEQEENLMTIEYVDGKAVKVKQPFREYSSMKASFHHYGKLISTAPRYERVRNAKNYRQAAYNLQKCGYATDPHYGDKIISIIENYDLSKLDDNN